LIRAWLLDDEALAVKRLSRMLEATGRVEIAGTSTDPEEALEKLSGNAVDVVFLDIEMPGCNGFEFLRRLETRPAVVFVTAWDQYAVRAFEANGTDYLLKPVTAEALDRAIAKLERNKAVDPDQYRLMLEKLTAALDVNGRHYPRRIPSRLGDRVQFIELEKVSYFFAEEKLTYAVTGGKQLVVDDSIIQLEAKLDPEQFHRIHRGYLVNLTAVAEVCSWFGGKMVARLNDVVKTELPVSRDRVRSLKDRLGF
jgi:two-component system LytT family response regulator